MKISINLSAERKLKYIISKVEITNPKTGAKHLVDAMWDTGATFTCISYDFAKRCGFIIKDSYDLLHPTGGFKTEVPNYEITLRLDTQKTAHYDLKAGSFEGSEEFDVIIGMDMFIYGQLSMGVKNNIFQFEFIENIYLKNG
jgi:hypothetical protein